MKRKLYILATIAIMVWVVSFSLSVTLGIILTLLGMCFIGSVIVFIYLNKLLMCTNWWKNQYNGTEQFVSNFGYRDNHIRNYDIINLGSTPARYAFFYENIKGQSWATGSQGQDMDFEILKYYHSYLKEGGIVIIPIMPFTAISSYIKTRDNYWGFSYFIKFYKILSYSQRHNIPDEVKHRFYLRFPLIYKPRAIIYLFHDQPIDNRFFISEQGMDHMELLQDAKHWINLWLEEFKLRDLNNVFDETWSDYYHEAIELNKQIVDFCIERGLKPVFMCVPMSKYLSDLFPEEVRKFLITDFVQACNDHNIPFYDYTLDSEFQDANLYFLKSASNLNGNLNCSKELEHYAS